MQLSSFDSVMQMLLVHYCGFEEYQTTFYDFPKNEEKSRVHKLFLALYVWARKIVDNEDKHSGSHNSTNTVNYVNFMFFSVAGVFT